MLKKEQEDLGKEITTLKNRAYNDRLAYDKEVERLRKSCEEEVDAAIREKNYIANKCRNDNKRAEGALSEAELYRDKQQALLQEEEEQIDNLANKKIETLKESLVLEKKKEVMQIKEHYNKYAAYQEKYYKREYQAKESWHVIAFTFCVLWLLIQAFSSNYLRSEIINIASAFKDYVVDAGPIILEMAVEGALKVSNIENEVLSQVIYWVVIVVYGLILFLIYYIVPAVLIFGGSIAYFKSKYFDKFNRWVMIGTGILLVAMSSEMFHEPPIHILYIWIIIQIVVPVIRYILIPIIVDTVIQFKGLDESKKENLKNNVFMILFVLALFGFLLFALKIFTDSLSELFR